jgi:glutamine synthetase
VSDVSKILDDWSDDGVRYVRFELPDMHGLSRSKTVPLEHAGRFAERGLNMYGGASVLDSADSVVSGTLYNEEVKYRDQFLHPDPDTATVVPWVENTGRFICDTMWHDGTPLGAAPRHVFRRVLEKARGMGYEPVMGSEFEFYLLDEATREPLFPDFHIFNTIRNDWVPTVRRILDELPKVGVSIITANCEYAASQWEINFSPGRALAGPDIAFTFKNGVKEIAKQDGLIASFMSKPFWGASGSGCHTHMSLVRSDDGANAFGDADDPEGISEVCRYFTGGILRYAKVIDPLVLPTVNCYRRRRPHTFSPTNVSWGVEDRTALVRVKGFGPVESRHIEYRAPTALSNPYLVGAAMLAAGLRGIEEKIDPGPSYKHEAVAEGDPDFEPLPASLPEAMDAFESDPASREFFGEEFVDAYSALKRFELSRFNDWVTDWERNEYLEVY